MESPALLLIDVQYGLDESDYYGGGRNNPQAEQNCATILSIWRKENWPVIHVKHNSTEPQSPLRPGQRGNDIKTCVAPIEGEPVFEKNVNSAFIGTELELYLRKREIHKLVVVGLTTDHCVSTSVRMAGNLGFDTWLVGDATATFDKVGSNGQIISSELIHEVHLASLNEEFATVIQTDDLPRIFY